MAALMILPQLALAEAREPILAGSWYTDNPDGLRRTVLRYIDLGEPTDDPILALIVPHAGYTYSGSTAGKGFATVRGRSFDRVILIGPSHRYRFDGAALPPHDAWKTPLGEVPIDRRAVRQLEKRRWIKIIPDAHSHEHSLEIELPFLQVALEPGFGLVPMAIGSVDEDLCREIADGIREILTERTLIVVSSDFTHYGPNYGYVPFHEDIPQQIHELDHGAISAIESLSPNRFQEYRSRTGATICGAGPIRVLLTLLADQKIRTRRLGYARSGEMMGDFTNSVSYVAMAFSPAAEDAGGGQTARPPRMLDEREKSYVLKLARETLRAELTGGPPPPLADKAEFGNDSPLFEVRGVFVTLEKGGRLRGCMGNSIGEKPLVEGVAVQSIISAREDPRFPQVTASELDAIEMEISVLTPLMEVGGYQEIEVGRHGVLIEKQGRRAVFLPQVAPEQGWDRDTMLRHLCQKAGLGPDEWRKGMTFYVFEAQVFGETEAH
jgi:AmmeMemoRadiSam system protein B/AmmeMemoRadiSam system protein A